jgi:hypothetical protein
MPFLSARAGKPAGQVNDAVQIGGITSWQVNKNQNAGLTLELNLHFLTGCDFVVCRIPVNV